MTRTATLPCAAAALVTVLTSCCAALAFELVIQVAAEVSAILFSRVFVSPVAALAAVAAWVFGFTQKSPLGVGVGVGVGTVPVQVTPLSLNVVGTALDPLQEPLNPKLVDAPVARPPFQDRFATETLAPLWVTAPFHSWVTF